ncbi:hypothetical protein GQ42DRAFT_181696 [Ramicandelaber brevisporus]|nr:hypothetical protein GQ42DRAFT_181696 [Ramicandelaber brevisporus]
MASVNVGEMGNLCELELRLSRKWSSNGITPAIRPVAPQPTFQPTPGSMFLAVVSNCIVSLMDSQSQTSVKKKRGRPQNISMGKCKTCIKGIRRGCEREHICESHGCSEVELYAIRRLAGWPKESVDQYVRGHTSRGLDEVKFKEDYWVHITKDADGTWPDNRPSSAEHYEQYKQYLNEGMDVLKHARKWNKDTDSQTVMERVRATSAVTEQSTVSSSPPVSAIASVTADSTSIPDGDHSSGGTISNSTRSRPVRSTRTQGINCYQSSNSRSAHSASARQARYSCRAGPASTFHQTAADSDMDMDANIDSDDNDTELAVDSSGSGIATTLFDGYVNDEPTIEEESSPWLVISSSASPASAASVTHLSNSPVTPPVVVDDNITATFENEDTLIYSYIEPSYLTLPPQHTAALNIIFGEATSSREVFDAPAVENDAPGKKRVDRLADVASALDITYLVTMTLNRCPRLLDLMRPAAALDAIDTHPSSGSAATGETYQPLGQYVPGNFLIGRGFRAAVDGTDEFRLDVENKKSDEGILEINIEDLAEDYYLQKLTVEEMQAYFEDSDLVKTMIKHMETRAEINNLVEEQHGRADRVRIHLIPISAWQDLTGKKHGIELFRISFPFLEQHVYTRLSPIVGLYSKSNKKLGKSTDKKLVQSFERRDWLGSRAVHNERSCDTLRRIGAVGGAEQQKRAVEMDSAVFNKQASLVRAALDINGFSFSLITACCWSQNGGSNWISGSVIYVEVDVTT